MFSYLFQYFTRKRCDRAIATAVTVTISLYAIVTLIAEPLRALAGTNTSTAMLSKHQNSDEH